MAITQFASVRPASPSLRPTNNAPRVYTPPAPKPAPKPVPKAAGWGDWLNDQRDKWNARYEQPKAPDRRLDERSTPYYNAGFYRGTNANYGGGVTVPQGVSPNFHNDIPASIQGGAGVANPMMAVRGGYGAPAPKVDLQVARPSWSRPSQDAPPLGGNSFVSGDGLRVNMGEGETRFIGPDWKDKYLSDKDFMDMYLGGRFSMLPPDEGAQNSGFGSYYGGWGGGGWGSNGWGSNDWGSNDWEQDKRLSAGQWNIN